MTSQPPPQTTYHHSQRGPWSLLLLAIACVMLVTLVLNVHEPVVQVLCPSIAALFLVLAACFHELTVADRGDRLAIHFGPLPLFRRSLPFSEITGIEPGRTLLVEGWGVHLSPRGGWVWNIWGRDCVVIHRGRYLLRLGTDDVENLVSYLKERTTHAADGG